MKEFLKKSWFVILVGVILLGVAGVMAWDTISQQLPSKQVDGKDVVFSYDGTDFTADEMYDLLYDAYGFNTVLNYVELNVYSNAFEPDADLISEAKIQTNTVIQNLQYEYGEDYKDIIEEAMKSLGYSGSEESLLDYYTTILMMEEVRKDYVKEHIAEYYPKYQQEEQPRIISHILVAMEDPDNPTEEELAKLTEVQELLTQENADFAAIATSHSDDTASAAEGGSLGFVDKSSMSNYVENFQNFIYTVGVGETTEWFMTEYGYHIIRVDSENIDDFVNDDNFVSQLISYYPDLSKKITWDQIEKQDIVFSGNEELITKIKEYYNVEIDTAISDADGNDGGE